MSRGGLKISRVSGTEPTDTSDKVDWLEAFARKLKASEPSTAVEAARVRDAKSLHDQISAIMGNKPNFTTVDEKVQYYRKQMGLDVFLQKMNEEKTNMKIAIAQLPESFNKFTDKDKEDIVNFVKNKCETHHGNIQVPALVEEVSQTFRQRGIQPQDVNSMEFEKFISDEILNAKKQSPTVDEHNVNIGRGVGLETDIDAQEGGLFDNLMPVK